MRLIKRAQVREDDHILDIGCGTGALTVQLARLACKGWVVGLDPSEDMLKAARRKAEGLLNIEFINAGAEEMALPQGGFTLAYSSNALQWVLEQEAAHANMYNALSPGGRLVVQLPCEGFSHALTKSIWGAVERLDLRQFGPGRDLPWYLPAPADYARLLEDTGFMGVEIMTEQFDMTFQCASDALGWALSAALVPFLARMDESEAERFKYAVCMNFEEHRRGGAIVFDFRRVIALAQKNPA